jgi:hypothetical protein
MAATGVRRSIGIVTFSYWRLQGQQFQLVQWKLHIHSGSSRHQLERIGNGSTSEFFEKRGLVNLGQLTHKILHGCLPKTGDADDEKGHQAGAAIFLIDVRKICNGHISPLGSERITVAKYPLIVFTDQPADFQTVQPHVESDARLGRCFNPLEPLHLILQVLFHKLTGKLPRRGVVALPYNLAQNWTSAGLSVHQIRRSECLPIAFADRSRAIPEEQRDSPVGGYRFSL